MPSPQPPPLESGLVEVRTTFGSREAAEACAERLVRDSLAACVQVDGPVTSTYVWQGRIERAEEWRCGCKTTEAAAAGCVAAILAGHAYETPQVVVVPVQATAAYAAWVRAAVRPA
jgi:periplasmic divalent cation tolerance protein